MYNNGLKIAITNVTTKNTHRVIIPHGGDGSPTDSTTTGGLGLLNSRSETGDADLLPRTGSVLSALSAVSAAASDVTRASVASEAMFVPPKETDDERPRTRGWLDW